MIVIILLLLVMLAILSILEVSFSSLNIIRIKRLAESGNKAAKVVYMLYSKYSETLTTILVINCVCSVLVSSLTTYYFSNLYGDKFIPLVTIILTIVILVFTEITPKIIGREYAEDFALKLCNILKGMVSVLTPITKIIGKFEKKVKNNHRVTATKDELVEIVKTIKEEGVIEEKESIFIQNAVLLKKLKVSNVMVDRDDVSFLYDTDSSEKVKNCIFRDKHDRIPIINREYKVMGILYEVDLLDEILHNRSISIKRNMKAPVTVSKTTNLASCLEILESARAHMAIVTDRENNFLGIITMEDIITELMKSQFSLFDKRRTQTSFSFYVILVL